MKLNNKLNQLDLISYIYNIPTYTIPVEYTLVLSMYGIYSTIDNILYLNVNFNIFEKIQVILNFSGHIDRKLEISCKLKVRTVTNVDIK